MISERSFARLFDSFWHELLPLLTPHFVGVFNDAYELPIFDQAGEALSALPLGGGVERPDLVAEFAFRLAKLAHESGLDCASVGRKRNLIKAAEIEALRLIQRYEGEKPANVTPLTKDEKSEALKICARYGALYESFRPETAIEFCPVVKGAGFLNAGEADIGIGRTLVEVKTTTRKPSGKDLRQLLIYLALDANAGNQRWSNIALFNPRRGTLHFSEVDALVYRLSGGQAPANVFAELISFTESNEPSIERAF